MQMDTHGAIERINATPMEQLRFRDFVNIKVEGGRDRFSNLRKPALQERVGQDRALAVVERVKDRRRQDAAMRWILRGLETQRAIRKALTDAEVGMNASHQHPGLDTWRQEETW